jgi:hypothetical protein
MTTTAEVCQAIETLDLMTCSDAANILNALALRAAQTPIGPTHREPLFNLFAAAHRDALLIWLKEEVS